MDVSKLFNRIKDFVCKKKPHAKIEPENKLTRDIINKVKKYDDNDGKSVALTTTRPQFGNIIIYRSSRQNLQIDKSEKVNPIDEEVKEEPAEKIKDILNKPIKIKVNIDVITADHYEKIIEKYNEIKPETWQPLQRLPRAEGGFQLEIPEKKDIKTRNQNQKIKQLRWDKKCLVPYQYYLGFNHRETEILYHAMKSVFGDNVFFESV
uniref:Uncharacterized protein n=1 Tax=viral metagenome TaxID=1070528 RepID=A0A6C0HB16_9ZZZZ